MATKKDASWDEEMTKRWLDDDSNMELCWADLRQYEKIKNRFRKPIPLVTDHSPPPRNVFENHTMSIWPEPVPSTTEGQTQSQSDGAIPPSGSAQTKASQSYRSALQSSSTVGISSVPRTGRRAAGPSATTVGSVNGHEREGGGTSSGTSFTLGLSDASYAPTNLPISLPSTRGHSLSWTGPPPNNYPSRQGSLYTGTPSMWSYSDSVNRYSSSYVSESDYRSARDTYGGRSEWSEGHAASHGRRATNNAGDITQRAQFVKRDGKPPSRQMMRFALNGLNINQKLPPRNMAPRVIRAHGGRMQLDNGNELRKRMVRSGKLSLIEKEVMASPRYVPSFVSDAPA